MQFSPQSSYDRAANLLLARILLPNTKKMYGKGNIARVMKAMRAVAHWKPSFSYIWTPNKGKAAVFRCQRVSMKAHVEKHSAVHKV